MSTTGQGKKRRAHDKGPTGMDSARFAPTAPMVRKLNRIIPTAMTRHEHYDTRNLRCVRCGFVPKKRILLDDTPEGYVCRAAKSCAERAKESYD